MDAMKEKISKRELNERRVQRAILMKKAYRILGGVLVLVGIGWLGWYMSTLPPVTTIDVTKMCIQHQNLAMHIHPQLRISIKGENVLIPANTGIPSTGCMRPLHTHDSTGTIHIEFPFLRDAKLGEFFQIWEKTFNQNCIFDYCNGPEGTVKIRVNGVESVEFENVIMHDHDVIEIVYE
jgi:hypothetical protein